MRYKEDIDLVKKRMDAFWCQEKIDRACIAVVASRRNIRTAFKNCRISKCRSRR